MPTPRDRQKRAPKAKRRSEPFPLILEIEPPLIDAINYAEALRLMGQGLVLHDETGGDAIVALAWETTQRLATVKKIWNKMLDKRRTRLAS